MSEQGAKPEVLPGDLITRVGLYEARCGEIVPITGWDDGWWITERDGVRSWYASNGRQRFYEGPDADEWQLLHWVGPLPATEPETETTSEQLAEIEGQAEDTPATEYTPPEGWRVLAVGELVMLDDQWVRQDGSVWRSMGTEGPVSEGSLYIRRIEPEPVWVCEGRWRQRNGDIRNVTPTPLHDIRKERWPWRDAEVNRTWSEGGLNNIIGKSPLDLVEYLGPIEEQPEPQPETTSEQLADIEGQAEDTPATEYTPTEHWRVLQVGEPLKGGDEYHEGLNSYIRRIEVSQPEAEPVSEPQPEPQPESDAELRIRLLKQCNDTQAETIKRLMAEARDLNMEIGGLQRQLLQRDARIRDLETIYSAATKSFEDANRANDALRAQVRILQQEADKKNSRIEFLETLNAGNGAAIADYIAKVAKLQGLVDTARGQLEAAATERDELRAAIDAADKQLDQKDAQIRDLRIELDAAQQVPRPVGDEEREQIWDQATEQAGRRVIGWLRPLTLALNRQPDARFSRFMAMTLSILPDILPELLGYAAEDEAGEE